MSHTLAYKVCSKCKETKHWHKFSKDRRNSDGLQSQCKGCTSLCHKRRYDSKRSDILQAKKDYHQDNKDSINAKKKEYRKLNPGKIRDSEWRKKGIDPRQARQAFAKSNQCQICESTIRLVPDHSHDTGIVRGILCNKCNLGIGLFNDNPELLKNAVGYLQSAVGPVS